MKSPSKVNGYAPEYVGVCNQNTEYHDRIIRLINANSHLIKERITA